MANFVETINCPCCKRQLGKDEYRRTKRKVKRYLTEKMSVITNCDTCPSYIVTFLQVGDVWQLQGEAKPYKPSPKLQAA